MIDSWVEVSPIFVLKLNLPTVSPNSCIVHDKNYLIQNKIVMLIRDSFDKLNMIFQGDQLRTKRLIIKVMNKKVEVEVNDQMNTWELL